MSSDFGGHMRAFCLSVFEFRITQRFHVDGENFESGPRVDAYFFDMDKKDAFSEISG